PEWTNCPYGSRCRTRHFETVTTAEIRPSCQSCGDVERRAAPSVARTGPRITGMETGPEATRVSTAGRLSISGTRLKYRGCNAAGAASIAIARQYDAAAGSIEQELRFRAIETPARP